MATKSLVREVGQEAFAAGELHIPELPRGRTQLEILEAEVDPLVLSVALQAGEVVVAREFEELVAEAQEVEVFADQIIDGRRSAHGVTFGRLLGPKIRSSGKLTNGRTTLNVALKPFASPDDAVNEALGYNTIRDLDVPTFQPVGIFPAQKGESFVGVTVKRDALQSLDRMRWVKGRMVDSDQTMYDAQQNTQHVKGIAETLAYINANGVFHPDGQIKNYAVTASGKIGIIDTEGLIKRSIGDHDTVDLAWNDINKLVKSLIISSNEKQDDEKMFGVGMLAHMSLHSVRSSVEELIIHPYIARLEALELGATGEEEVAHINFLYNGIIERFYSDREWPQHFIDANR